MCNLQTVENEIKEHINTIKIICMVGFYIVHVSSFIEPCTYSILPPHCHKCCQDSH